MNALALFVAVATGLQDKPQDILKKDLPKEAECTVCTAKGAPMGLEKPVAGVLFKGKPFFFCNKQEIGEFKKNPDLFVPLELPMSLPALNLKDQGGKEWNSEAFKGKLILLDYWATWCKPCLALKPKIDKVRAEYQSKGFEVLSISIDEKRSVLEQFLKRKPFDNPVAFDDKQTWAKLKVITIPALFLVKDGNIVAVLKGNVEEKMLESAVKTNLP